MKSIFVDTDNYNMLKVENSDLKFSFQDSRVTQLGEARKEIKEFLKHHHVNDGEQLVTSFGTFTRFDFHFTHLGTTYYFLSELGEKLRIEI